MNKKLKVVPDKGKGQDFKPFQIEAKVLNLTSRAELNYKIMDTDRKQNFSFWLEIIKENTDYSDEVLNDHSLDELVAISSAIIEDCNKKKLKK